MAAGEDWTREEVDATVADYMHMLTLELSGQRYNKSEHRRRLIAVLDGRTDRAIDAKHQNISAVLAEMGCNWIAGYKPYSNYQQALAESVLTWIGHHPEFDRVSLAAAELPAVSPSDVDFTKLLVPAPAPRNQVREVSPPWRINRGLGIKRDYLAREARNAALGRAGEELVLHYEHHRLWTSGLRSLAEKIEHVAQTKGDGLGFDILSFEESGQERFIEVKTTAHAKETPFFATANEVAYAKNNASQFHLYRLFSFRSSPRLFTLRGPLEDHCRLDPVNYRCELM